MAGKDSGFVIGHVRMKVSWVEVMKSMKDDARGKESLQPRLYKINLAAIPNISNAPEESCGAGMIKRRMCYET
jgi:hypothetical protein